MSFLDSWTWIWAKLAPSYSKRHLQQHNMPFFPQSPCSIAFLLRHAHKSKFLGFLKRKQVKVSDKKEQRFSCIVTPFLSSSSKLIVQFCLNSVRLDIVNSLVSSISCTSNRTYSCTSWGRKKCLYRSFRTIQCSLMKCLPMEEDCLVCCSTIRWCKCLKV